MRFRFLLLVFVTTLVLLGAPLLGHGGLIGLTELLSRGSIGHFIFWQVRLPRAVVAFLCGGGLALGGAAFQAMFRNPLATPYTLGVSSGAAFGAALALNMVGGLAAAILPVGALLGAFLAVGVVWLTARLRPDFSPIVLLLAGVAMTFFFSSLILFIQYSSGLTDSFRIVRWLMGGLASASWGDILLLAPFLIVGGLILSLRIRDLDLLSISTDIAAGRGVDVARSRQMIFLGSSIIVAGVVAICGPIGFVGMMAPHICRLLVGGRHRVLVPASMLFGASFLMLCDTVARILLFPLELPVGIITAFLGGPFFLWLLIRRTRSSA